ncbi:hypothetical protein JXL21_01770 [Candidatus Bathyarchaeota archaeon]|nr:hypothetical protein [Candidatus Bathyarchaeota archaeon]
MCAAALITLWVYPRRSRRSRRTCGHTQINKATELHLGVLKARLAKLKHQLEE